MLRNYGELENYLLSNKISKNLILVGAQDIYALSSLVQAKRKGIVHGILVGNKSKIISELCILGESHKDYEIIDENDRERGIQLSIHLLEKGKADLLMVKHTNIFEYKKYIKICEGLIKTNAILSECSILEYENLNKLITITDRSINTEPDLKQKMKIIKNAVELAQMFEPKFVKVAILSPLNELNSTDINNLDAYALSTLKLQDCIVEGPCKFKKVISNKSYENKKSSDVLLCSDLYTGNAVYNALKCSSKNKTASILCGTKYPIVLSNILDNTFNQYYSILVGVLQSVKGSVLS